MMLGLAVVDLHYLPTAFVYPYDRVGQRLLEVKKLAPPSALAFIRPTPETPDCRFVAPGLNIRIHSRGTFADPRRAPESMAARPAGCGAFGRP